MPIHLRPRNPRCRAAAAESVGPAARRIVKATAESTEALQAVMNRSPRYPADPATAFAALLEFRRAQAAVDAAVAEYCAWCLVGGVARTAMATGLGIRGATLARMLGPVQHIAGAGANDLIRSEGGTWSVHRGELPTEIEQTL
jgi:hypothetical protein